MFTNYKKWDWVKYHDPHSNVNFTGVVVNFLYSEEGEVTSLCIRPDSEDLRNFLAEGIYVLGAAHWPTKLTLLNRVSKP